MGTGMARNMLKAGIPLRVWNRTRSRAEPLEAEGAAVCSDPADAVRGADIIVTMLSDGPAVFEAMTAAGPGLTAGQIWVQAATVGLAWLDELAELGAGPRAGADRRAGARHPEAGRGGPAHRAGRRARTGPATVSASGSGRSSTRSGRTTVWLDEVGAATRLKLVANSWITALNVAVGESVALAQALDVAPEAFLEAIRGGLADSAYLHLKARAIIDDDYTPSFSVAMAGKDARLIKDAGEAAGLRMDVAAAAAERFARAVALGHGEDDMAAAYFASFDGTD